MSTTPAARTYEPRIRDDVIALGCLAIAFVLCMGVAFGQSLDWLTPKVPDKVEWPPPPAFAPRSPVPKAPESRGPETFTPETFTRRTDDGMEAVIKIVDGKETVIKHVVRGNPGGPVVPYLAYWMIIEENGTEVEIRGPCMSACTWVAAVIPKSRLCFDANGYLAFHKVRDLNKDGSTSPDFTGTQEMVDSYPKDIRAWINAKGGYKKMPIDGLWHLRAPELWTMGYRKCAEDVIVNAIAKPADGTCPFGWTSSGSYCLRSGDSRR
jgi:hypothetical protein